MKKESIFSTVVKWIRFLSDLLDGAQEKYNKHFKTQGDEGPIEQIVESSISDEN